MKMRLQQAFFNSSQGPQHREFRKEILQTMQVGVGQRNKFCKNIISVPLPSVRFFEFEDKKASKTYKKITLLLPNYVIDAFY
ncbi:TPA: hypothetical protein SLC22_001971 [Staphylococcus aureus]|nr:hypothetical protein [Staphylococcus aureus]